MVHKPHIPSHQLTLRSVPSRARAKGLFLCGPIPLDWLGRAAAVPGRALHVGLAIWFRVGCEKSDTVRLTRKNLDRFKVGRHAGYRGLLALEKAGLVKVVRHPGRCPVVTLIRPS